MRNVTKVKDKVRSIRVSGELWEKAQEIAIADGTTRNELINRAIIHYCYKNAKKCIDNGKKL